MAIYSYSTHITRLNQEANDGLIGVQLGRVCIGLSIPVQELANKFNVSRNTIYNWFSGKHVANEMRADEIREYLNSIAAANQ